MSAYYQPSLPTPYVIGGLTPKVSCPSATVILLLLAFGPSVNNPPGPGLGPTLTLGLGRRVLTTASGEETSASDIDVGVAV